jgi:hypothetical protein
VKRVSIHSVGVKKGVSKADVICSDRLLPAGARALFVDDDIRELTEPRIAATETIQRLLFHRAV